MVIVAAESFGDDEVAVSPDDVESSDQVESSPEEDVVVVVDDELTWAVALEFGSPIAAVDDDETPGEDEGGERAGDDALADQSDATRTSRDTFVRDGDAVGGGHAVILGPPAESTL